MIATRTIPCIIAAGSVIFAGSSNTTPRAAAPAIAAWRFVLESQISPPDGSPGELGRVLSIALAADGSVFVSQESPARVDLFRRGSHVRSIGRRGAGPGEFSEAWLGVAGDTLFIQDPLQNRITLLSLDGKFLTSFHSTCCYTGTVVSDSGGRIWIPGPLAGSPGRGAWHRFARTGRLLDIVPRPADPPGTPSPPVWNGVVGSGTAAIHAIQPVPLQGERISAMQRSGRLVTGRTDQSRLVITNPGGDTTRTLLLDAVREPVSRRQRDSVFRQSIDAVDSRWRAALEAVAKPGDLPAVWPYWTGLAVDGGDRIWVGTPGRSGAVSVMRVFDRTGGQLGTATPPTDRIFGLTAWSVDRVAVLEEDSSGRPVIRVYRIERSQ